MSELNSSESGDFLKSHEDLRDKLEVVFYLGPHGTESDAKKIQGYLASADVYMPEINAWSEETGRLFSRLGKGDMGAYEELYTLYPSPFTRSVLGSIVTRPNRKLEVAMMDVPGTQYWSISAYQLQSLLTRHEILPTVDTTISEFGDNCRKIGEIQSNRDTAVARNIFDYLVKRLESGNLPTNRPLKVFSSFGTFHRQIIEELRGSGIPVEMAPESTLEDDLRDDIVRIYQKGDEPSKKLLQRAFLAAALTEWIISDDTDKQTRALRKIGESLPEEMLDELCEGIVEVFQPLRDHDKEKRDAAISAILAPVTGYSHLGPNEVNSYLESER